MENKNNLLQNKNNLIQKIPNDLNLNIYGIDLNDFTTSKEFALAITHFISNYTEENKANFLIGKYKYTHVKLFFNTPNHAIHILYKLDSEDLDIFQNIV